MIRGKNVEEAKNILRFTPKKGADMLLKVLNSAVANAEVKKVEDPEILLIEKIWIDQGPVSKRYMPRARGRADVLRKPTCHITIVVKEDLKAKEEAATRQAEIEAKKAKKRAAKKAKEKKAAPAAKKPTAKKPTAKKAEPKKKEEALKKGKDTEPAKKETKTAKDKAAPAKKPAAAAKEKVTEAKKKSK
ncbi:LSU ribosomal protein L22p (L17e) [hydrothermal vent metagenome]|uniref:LSU ribosomal protein L22p (L17e) n=1 Tax=hydrothermal vent metagenome TaxID=652676 RepID=A0A3B1BZR3_9ZZZZ